MRHYTLAAILSHQRVSLMDVLNCFRAFPLIYFVWVCARVCIDDLKSRKGGWDVGGWRDAVIRSGPLTSLCADKAGRTHTHSKSYTRTSKNDNTPQCYLHVALSSSTPPHILLYFIISFFLVETGGMELQHGESIRVYRRSNARFILLKSFARQQDFYQVTTAELYWLLISAQKQDRGVNSSSHLSSSCGAVSCITRMGRLKAFFSPFSFWGCHLSKIPNLETHGLSLKQHFKWQSDTVVIWSLFYQGNIKWSSSQQDILFANKLWEMKRNAWKKLH